MTNIVEFPGRPEGSAPYIDRDAIEAACAALTVEVGAIVIGSQECFDQIDPLAYEINAHVIAIRRALASIPEGE